MGGEGHWMAPRAVVFEYADEAGGKRSAEASLS